MDNKYLTFPALLLAITLFLPFHAVAYVCGQTVDANACSSGIASAISNVMTNCPASCGGGYDNLANGCVKTYCKAATAIPAVPTSISAVTNGASISISWASSVGATSYQLQRDNVALTAGAFTNFNDTSAIAGIAYTYKVSACNSTGCSGWVTASTTSIPNAPGYFCGQVVDANACSSGIASAISNVITNCPSTCGGGYENLANGCVKAYCKLGTVTSLSASINSTSGVASLNWVAPSNTSYYYIRVKQNGTTLSTQTKVSATTSATLASLNVAGTYSYLVSACNAADVCSVEVESNTVSVEAPTVTASLSPNPINESESATLTWSSTSAVGCSATGISGVSATSGSVVYFAPTTMSTGQTITIPVTCSGGGGSKTTSASLTINPVNDVPTISGIGPVNIQEDNGTGIISFNVADEETAASSLVVSAISSNTNLIPNANIVLGGSGGSRTISAAPLANAFGNSTITVTVSDGQLTASSSFVVTVAAVNDLPTISSIANISLSEDATNTGIINFTVGDVETAAGSLTVNTSIISQKGSSSSFTLTNGGTNRTIQIQASAIDIYNVAITVSDGVLSATRNFTVTVNDIPAKLTLPTSSTTGVFTAQWAYAKEVAKIVGSGFDTSELSANGSRQLTINTSGTYAYDLYDCYHVAPEATCTKTDSKTIVVTLPLPPAPAAINAALNSSTGIPTISWSSSSSATHYEVQQGLGGSWGATINTAGTSLTLPAITVVGTYTYRVRACIDLGTYYTGCSSYVSSTALSISLPSVPVVTLPESSITGSFTLTWPAIANASSYVVNENGVSASVTAVSFTPTTKSNSTNTYQVKACNALGCSAFSAIKKIDVAIVGTQGAITANMAQTTGVPSLTWAAVAGATRYDIQPKLNGVATGSVVSVTTSSAILAKVTTIGSYSYQVKACAVVGSYTNCSTGVDSNIVTMALPAVPVLTLPAFSKASTFTMTWAAITNASSYVVKENNIDLSPSLTSTSFTPSAKANGTNTYQLKACNALGCSAFSAIKQIDVVVIAAPTNVVVTLDQATGIPSLNWSSVSNATRYEIQPLLNAVKLGGVITVTNVGASLSAVSQVGAYTYNVRACAVVGISTNCSGWILSNSVKPEIPATPVIDSPIYTATGIFTVSWSRAIGATHYKLYENNVLIQDAKDWTKIFSGYSAKATGTYSYQVQACKVVCGALSNISTTIVTIPSGTPTVTPPSTINITKSTLLTDGNINEPAPMDVPAGTPVGTTAGQFRVDESGAATYSIPLSLADGVTGVKPQLSINYSSQGGNGLLGLGWSLGGLSAINRCRQTVSQDSVAKEIAWSADDRFCLNGQRLMLVSGTYGSSGSTYKTEIDTYVTVTAIGGVSGHPAYFTAQAKDGSTSYYGNTADSILVGSNTASSTLTWALNSVQDNANNKIDFIYNGDANSGLRVKTINYAFSNSVAAAKIVFNYEARPDSSTSYIKGYAFKQAQRLASIDVFNNSSNIRTYKLIYQTTTGQPAQTTQLAKLQECVGMACLPALSFTYAPNQAVSVGGVSTTLDIDQLVNYQLLDINGDGVLDIVWLSSQPLNNGTSQKLEYKMYYAIGGNNYSASQNIADFGVTFPTYIKLKVIDYNGDGRSDVMLKTESGWQLYISQPNANGSWSLVGVSILPSSPLLSNFNSDFSALNVSFGDLDGNGTPEAFQIINGQSLLRVHKLVSATTEVGVVSRYKYIKDKDYPLAPITAPTPPISDGSYSNWTIDWISDGKLADFNGDGKVDIVVHANATGTHFPCNPLRNCQPYQTTAGSYFAYVASADGTSYSYYGLVANDTESLTQEPTLIDINGDGLTDIFIASAYKINTGTGFAAAKPIIVANPQFADLNRDGSLDIAWVDKTAHKILYAFWDSTTESFVAPTVTSQACSLLSGAYGAPPGMQTCTSNTTTLALSDEATVDTNEYSVIDMQGDGWADVIQATPLSGNKTRLTFKKSLNHFEKSPGLLTKFDNGSGNTTDIEYGQLNVNNPNYTTIWGANSSGQTTSVCTPFTYDPSITNCYLSTTYTTNVTGFYDQLLNPFGYLSTENNVGTDYATQPILEVTGPMSVVTRVDSSAPAAGVTPNSVNTAAKSSLSYFYHHMRMQAAGRGFLGFEKLTTLDQQTGVRTETTYRQDWPFIGSPLKSRTFVAGATANTDLVLSEAKSTWSSSKMGNVVQVYLKGSEEKSYAIKSNGKAQGNLLQTVTTDNVYDAYGNPTSVSVVTSGKTPSGGSTLLTKVSTNTYGTGDVDYKRMGRLTSSSVRTTRDNELPLTRTSAFTYYADGEADGIKWLLKTEIVEPGNAAGVTTQYFYDSVGNKIKVATTALGSSGQTETRFAVTIYDANYRYVTATANGLSQQAHITSRNEYGEPTEATDINNIGTQVYYDAMGQEYLRTDNTGAWSRTDNAFCGGNINCPAGAKYRTLKRTAGGGSATEYYDVLGRTIRSSKIAFDGRTINVDTEYDNISRIKRQSAPYFEGATPAGWTTNDYDLIGRVTKVTLPDTTFSTSSYDDYSTTVTNALNQTRTETSNGLGQLSRVNDGLGNTLDYQYDIQGGLLSATTTSTTNQVVTVRMCYDTFGRKIAMLDPDKGGWLAGSHTDCSSTSSPGWWHYNYDGFGELITQTDPKGQLTTMAYDQIGRMVKRVDEVQTRWFYDKTLDGSSPAGSQGKLMAVVVRANGADITECLGTDICTQYYYDQYARLTDTLVLNPNDTTGYVASTLYDSIGRPYEQRDALNGAVFNDSGTQTQYNAYGYAYRTLDIAPVGGGTGVLTTVIATNERGQVTQELRGNGATTYTTYNSLTGLLERQYATNALGFAVIQDENYRWDAVGNLQYRLNNNANVGSTATKNLGESFCYDGLNRLIKSVSGATTSPVCSGTQDVSYDGLGNITQKKGVGSYVYGTNAGPHAVTNAGGVAYTYDANGNQISGDGRTITYAAYDMAKTITKGGNSTSFSYGADHVRWQRVDVKGSATTTTTYLGNIERIQKSGSSTVEWKRYVGGVILTYKTNTGNQLLTSGTNAAYIYNDHLGSLDVITDAVGKVTNSLSFDPWGARRGGENWGTLTEAQRIAALTIVTGTSAAFVEPVTQRGFTGHEMVDDMGIIHMNGRIYDAKLGRFLQADPFIQSSANTQSYNRYSYLLNNPLNATDPSGFFLKHLWNKIRPFVGAIVTLVANYYCGCGSVIAGMIGGAAGAAANGENIFKGAVFGAFSGAAGGVGQTWQGFVARGLIGGLQGALSGGKFGNSFLAAGIGGAFGGGDPSIGNFLQAAVVGGVVSEITGGKFINGAAGAAFMYAVSVGVQKIGAGGTDHSDTLSAQPKEGMTTEEYQKLNVNDFKKGEEAATEANAKLSSIANKEFSSAKELAIAWDLAVRPVSDKYGVEIASRIFLKDESHFMFGAAYSDGNTVRVNTSLAPDLKSPNWREHGYIHTHPWNETFSGADINWLKFRDNPMGERAYVTLANGQIFEGRLGGSNGQMKRIY